jgi:hypothetical protein
MDDWTNGNGARLNVAVCVLAVMALVVAVAYTLASLAPPH